jgi:predicted metal-dependent peptidase
VQKFKGTPAQREAFEEKVEEQVQQALETAKAMGNAPVGMQMAMKAIFKVAEEKWFDHLRRFFHGMRRREYDWGQANRRMAMAYRVVAPTAQSPSLGPVVTFIDASGSCFTTAQQADFGGHVNSILSEAQPERLFVAYFEMDVTEHYEVDPGEMEFEARPRGGGGTSFEHLFDWVSEQGIQPSVVIVLTDMYGTFPKEEPPYPVIWASTSPGEKAPFGEVIEIK